MEVLQKVLPLYHDNGANKRKPSNLFSLLVDGCGFSNDNLQLMTSSIKLHFSMVQELKPWLLLKLLNEEFVKTVPDEPLTNEVGTVQFGKMPGKIYQVDDTFYLKFEDGRTFAVTPKE